MFEVYAAVGLIIYVTIFFFGWFCMPDKCILWLQILGMMIFIPACFFTISSFQVIAGFLNIIRQDERILSRKPWILIDKGIFSIIRHPLYFGLSIWIVAMILIFQCIYVSILGLVGIICFYLSSVQEDKFNIKKFGHEYELYMMRVPRWNVIKGWLNLKKCEKNNM
jgi:protein-S-isoprenylcysteine O-methyltransferase Ste14